MSIEDRAQKYVLDIYENVDCEGLIPIKDMLTALAVVYKDSAKMEQERCLDAYCKSHCNLNRNKCLSLGGICKQYERFIKSINE